MKIINWRLLTFAFGIIVILHSCQNNNQDQKSLVLRYDFDATDILHNWQKWYTYYSNYINLANDFSALDKDSNNLNKKDFINLLATGNYVPFRVFDKDSIPCYKLFSLPSNKKDIGETIMQLSGYEIENMNMEGLLFPDFSFTDLKNNKYDNTTVAGKYMVVKCWFIDCLACVKEFPELNRITDEFKNRNDILFVSLAWDSKTALQKFLQTKPFKYEVVPNQEDFTSKKLHIKMYPTHIVMDKDGKILKVVNNVKELEYYLYKHLPKQEA